MKNTAKYHLSSSPGHSGFTLLEFMAAMSIFLILSSAVFWLFRKDDPLFNQQQNQSSLNIALQNSITQIQLDTVNAGSGYYGGTNIPNWPIGVTFKESVATAGTCGGSPNYNYTTACFDTLNLLTVDSNTPPLHLTGAGGCALTTASPIQALSPAGYSAAQITALAALYRNGDQLLMVNSDGSQMTTIKLRANGAVSGTNVQLTFNATNADGTNTAANDPLDITTHTNTSDNPHNMFGTQYCGNDWVLRLLPVTYKIDASTPSNPKLVRVQNGVTDILAEQIIGFKVGASLWNFGNDTDLIAYNYHPSQFCTGTCSGGGYDFTLVRSIRVSIIGRTPPNASADQVFRNTFDQGPYAIQALSVVVNPRNLSMSD